MSLLSRLSIRTKLWSSFALLLLVLGLIAVSHYASQRIAVTTLDGAIRGGMQRSGLANEIRRNFLVCRLQIRDVLLATDTRGQAAHLAEARALVASIDGQNHELERRILRKELYQAYAAKWQAYKQTFASLASQLEQHQMREAKRLQDETLSRQGAALQAILADIIDFQQQRLETTIETAKSDAVTTLTLILALLLFGALPATVIGALVIRAIVRSLNQTERMLAQIAAGEGDLTQRVIVSSDDEIGRMSTWFNRFIEQLNHIIGQTADAAREVSATAQQMSASSEEVARATQQVTVAIEQAAQGSAQQAELVSGGAQEVQ